jgi:hypothetical protein
VWTEKPKEEEEKELNGAVEKLKITDMDENTKGIPKVKSGLADLEIVWVRIHLPYIQHSLKLWIQIGFDSITLWDQDSDVKSGSRDKKKIMCFL